MRFSPALRHAATRVATATAAASTTTTTAQATKQRNLKSLALSVYFKQPDFGMKEYEVLARASAFLLGVDPPEAIPDGKYAHLEIAEEQRKLKEYQRDRGGRSPAGGPKGRRMMDLGWLEFVPKEYRPQVHVVCSSHVLAPFLWKDFYPQDWLSHVRREHCVYSLEVFDPNQPTDPLAKVALSQDPFHHPEGRDIGLIHLKDEVSSLKLLKRLGVDVLHLRDPDKLYEKGETMSFDGFVVKEPNQADSESFTSTQQSNKKQKDKVVQDDLRIFYPYQETGALSFHTQDRFFATTPEPLPEGLCGAPVLDTDGDACGCVEGIVPVDHKDKRLAGSAAFVPSYVIAAFVEYVERGLLEKMMPPELFQMAVTAKSTNSIGGGVFKSDGDGSYTTPSNYEEAYDIALEKLKKDYTPQEVDAILQTIQDERDQVLEIMNKEGGDLEQIMHRVRAKTLQIREMVVDRYRKGKLSELQAGDETPKQA